MFDGPNMFLYVTGNPVNIYDPLGLAGKAKEVKIGNHIVVCDKYGHGSTPTNPHYDIHEHIGGGRKGKNVCRIKLDGTVVSGSTAGLKGVLKRLGIVLGRLSVYLAILDGCVAEAPTLCDAGICEHAIFVPDEPDIPDISLPRRPILKYPPSNGPGQQRCF
jgi:hypothetical protein